MLRPLKKIIIIPSIVAICFLASFFLYQYQANTPLDLHSNVRQIFEIHRGDSMNVIAGNLSRQRLIRSAIFFDFYILIHGSPSKMQAGSYSLSPNMSIRGIADKLISGETIKISVTIPEGFRIAQITQKFLEANQNKRLASDIDNFDNFRIKNFSRAFDFLGDAPSEANLEGFLFPDTYQFSFGVTSREIVAAMLENFNKKLIPELKTEIQRRGKTIYGIVTMASILEKEVRSDEDMGIVSGILWKRIKIGMPLQVDATITYLTGKKTADLTQDDLTIDSPYNTYKYNGLPPGPITNPGLRAIKAAIYPKDSDYLYYLSARDGKTIFSKTLEEQNIAKNEYLR